MYQGETITTTITGFPVPVSEIARLYIVFKSDSRILLEKRLEDCSISGESLSFKLTQGDSLSLGRGRVERSLIAITKDGSRFESCPSFIYCSPTVKNEVL